MMFGSGKSGEKYFESFIEMCGYSCDAAEFLRKILVDYDPDALDRQREQMHAIEHDGDVAKHTMFKQLVKESKLPIEREDIIEMSEQIDTVTDSIEDVLLRLYMFNIRAIREDAITVADLVVKTTRALKGAIEEFSEFKTSKTLHDRLIEVNRLEEEGDRLYMEAVRHVFTDESLPPLTAEAWSHVFVYLEEVMDACEDVADVIEGVIMKNA
jgi:predicted phosphate transport protein (TIGR00153 family)